MGARAGLLMVCVLGSGCLFTGVAAAEPRGCDVVAVAPGASSHVPIEVTDVLSDDGDRMAYLTPAGGTGVLDADGSSRLVHPRSGDPVLSGDGSTVVLSHFVPSGLRALSRMAADGTGTPTVITPSGVGGGSQAVDDDGDTVVYDSFDLDTGAHGINVWASGSTTTLEPSDAYVVGYPSISGDGLRLAFTVDLRPPEWADPLYELRFFDREEGVWQERLDLSIVEAGVTSALDQTGGRVAYEYYGALRLAETGGEEVWAPDAQGWIQDLSSDGEAMLWAVDPGVSRLTRFNPDGSHRSIAVRGPGGRLSAAGVSDDGRRVAGMADDHRAAILECGDFGDVAPSHPFAEDITWMDGEEISTGYSNGDFRPGAAVSRQAMAAFLYRFAGEPATTPPATPSFHDVSTSHPFFDEVEWLVAEGIAEGYEDDTFQPLAPVSRQAMAAFLYRVADAAPTSAPEEPSFDDVSEDHPFFGEIEWMAAEGVSTGYEDHTFRPELAVSRQAMSAFLHRLGDLLAS